jgi:hypothetical protein
VCFLKKLDIVLLSRRTPERGAGRRKSRIVDLMAEAESRSHRSADKKIMQALKHA